MDQSKNNFGTIEGLTFSSFFYFSRINNSIPAPTTWFWPFSKKFWINPNIWIGPNPFWISPKFFFHYSRINNWIPAPKPKIFRDTNITLLHADEVSPHVIRVLFQASGPDHMGIYFSPKSGVTLTTWSFSDGELLEGPKWKDDRPTYYIFHSGGLSPAPWQFWLQFKVRWFEN